MKAYVFLLLICSITIQLSAQELPEKIKYDSLVISADGKHALIKKGKKSSLYDFDKQEFFIPPTKDEILYFKETGVFTRISKDFRARIYLFNEGAITELISRRGDACVMEISYPYESDDLFKNLIYYNDSWIN